MRDVLVPLIVVIVPVAMQFYFKWVPDIEDQKKHVKSLAFWAFDIFALGSPIVYLVMDAFNKAPVTSGFVVMVAFDVMAIFINGAFVVLRRTAVRRLITFYLEEPLRLSMVSRRHSKVAVLHEDAIRLIAEDPCLSRDTSQKVRDLLRDSPAAPEAEKPEKLTASSETGDK